MKIKDNRFAVIGMGQFGNAIARKLSDKGAEVIAIDTRVEKIENIKDSVSYAVALDATDKKALMAHGVHEVDAVVVAIGENFEGLLLCTYNLMEMNVKRIIARAMGDEQRKILERMGVKEILSPENEVGNNVAETLLNPKLLTYAELPNQYEIVEVKAPPKVVGRTLQDIGLREKYDINAVTILQEVTNSKDGKKDKYIDGVPSPDTVIKEADTVLLFGKVDDIERFLEINQ